ncbi:chemotaxis protein CheA [Pseudohongiella nitratireducens]|uniref:Chemotaxis protein CheA n=1 Tax=Pseudohongiella nitratireducens TaxID=1768907 RepID=A0A917GJT6_9GAMM|nr:chemotaxis protein CheA [Pseudohongiella nitratireducens]GGG48569.1 chemotaxis protein CheA [Pseudohongiella nitratireducens]|tara:strand:- start:2688 stop:4847 length:2160 start_codon:yes stop_codon:yes gene_type:complete
MSFIDDEEILEDFLLEAGEILEQLSEQLVQLEQQPDDKNLLNAIFRGFHTVKGGAGFLQLNNLVDCCHETENLFDQLRNGHCQVSSELMDVVLKALDAINAMFDQVKERQNPDAADPELLASLAALANGEVPPEQSASGISQDVTQARQDEDLMQQIEASTGAVEGAAEVEGDATDEMTDEEFEALLDQLQGKTAGSEQSASPSENASEHEERQSNDAGEGAAASLGSAASDEISDDEFEALLDALHGEGRHAGLPSTEASESSSDSQPKPAGNVTPFPTSTDAPPASSPAEPAKTEARQQAGGAASATPRPEDKVAAAPGKKESSSADTTVRVDTRRLDEIMNMVGELVLVRNRLVRLGSTAGNEVLSKAVGNLDLVTADLQSSVMKTRMQPIKKVFGRFPRVVRDLARNLKKEVNLELLGEETDLDKNLVEALADPLVHLVRNAVDHGIEQPEEREAQGKARQGTILLAAEQEGDHILLTISDDGHGMDPDVLRRKAVEKGLLDKDAADRLSDAECFDLIFAPGFSTKSQISDVSGRGVGMDVVKTKISQLNGTIAIESRPGKGSRIEIKVPLTLAIMPTLMIMVRDQTFALPLANVHEIFNLDLRRTHTVDGQQVVTVRDKSLPLFHLGQWLGHGVANDSGDNGKVSDDANVVIVNVGAQRVGFVVDTLIGQEEVVIKPLGRILHGTAGMAGATITGDGRIAVILDVPGLLKRYAA